MHTTITHTFCFAPAPALLHTVADPSREIAVAYGMIDPDLKDAEGLPLTCRSVFIIGETLFLTCPDKPLAGSQSAHTKEWITTCHNHQSVGVALAPP